MVNHSISKLENSCIRQDWKLAPLATFNASRAENKKPVAGLSGESKENVGRLITRQDGVWQSC